MATRSIAFTSLKQLYNISGVSFIFILNMLNVLLLYRQFVARITTDGISICATHQLIHFTNVMLLHIISGVTFFRFSFFLLRTTFHFSVRRPKIGIIEISRIVRKNLTLLIL